MVGLGDLPGGSFHSAGYGVSADGATVVGHSQSASGAEAFRWTETAGDEAYINVISKYFTREDAQTARLEIVALDPAKVTQPVFSSTYANVVMSGTLQPLDAFAKITKLPENTVQHIAGSPFPREHILPLVCCGVTTAMEYRTSEMYQTFIRRIQEVELYSPGLLAE